jgi:hypothetical protein
MPINISSSCKLSLLLWSLVLVPLSVTIITELNKTVLVWHMRIVDFTDLVLLAPFYLINLIAIHKVVFNNKNSHLSFLSFGLIGIIMYGHAMHLTGNTINTYSDSASSFL